MTVDLVITDEVRIEPDRVEKMDGFGYRSVRFVYDFDWKESEWKRKRDLRYLMG